MQTSLAEQLKGTAQAQEADRILRSCVHCGFCNATCPTYQLLGDELDGPRGRIYLIKSVLEGNEASLNTQRHLDRCLTCRACETTCPSGVEYGRLLDIGRSQVAGQVHRPLLERLRRYLLRRFFPFPARVRALLMLARLFRPILKPELRRQVARDNRSYAWPVTGHHPRKMIVLDGCVQPVLAPSINAAAARVMNRLGISLIRLPGAGCCGAISHHLAVTEEAKRFMRRNIDAWWPTVERGTEAIVITASGCATLVKDYGYLLRDDPEYADKAARISGLTRDIAEVLTEQDLSVIKLASGAPRRIAFHSPCSLQHGQGLSGVVEDLLQKVGFSLTPVQDAHICCGSAGTYSILQPRLSQQLLRQKVRHLEAGDPELIATANIGCLSYLRQAASTPVKHWIELLDA